MRVVPAPELDRTLVVAAGSAGECLALLAGALRSAHDVSAAAVDPERGSLLRLEGFAASVEARTRALCARAALCSADGARGRCVARAVGTTLASAAALAASPVVWRISVPPADALRVLERARARAVSARLGRRLDTRGVRCRRRGARARCTRRRARDAAQSAGRGARSHGRVPAAAAGGCRCGAAIARRVRSTRHLEPWPHGLKDATCKLVSLLGSSNGPCVAASEPILRKCVHCGFCTATCPTYVLARRRARQPARAYLFDQGHARERPACDGRRRAARRPLLELSFMHDDVPVGRALPTPHRSRARARRANLPAAYRASAGCAPRSLPCCRTRGACVRRWQRQARRGRSRACCPRPLRALLELAPRRRASAARNARAPRAAIVRRARKRVALVTGCVQTVIAPEINAATIRLLERCGVDVVSVGGCCGALVHHLGKERGANALAACARLAAACRAGRRRARCDRSQRLGLRYARQGLRLRVSRRSAPRCAGGRRQRFGARRDRSLGGTRLAACRRERAATDRRLSLGVLDAAWPESRAAAARAARCGRLRAQGDRGRASMLRLGRHLQRAAARDRAAVARAQARAYCAHRRRVSWRRATSAASRSSRAAPASPSCTPSSCSTGRRAGRGRRRSRT